MDLGLQIAQEEQFGMVHLYVYYSFQLSQTDAWFIYASKIKSITNIKPL